MIHLRIEGTKTFCARPGLVGLTLRWIVKHQGFAAQLMIFFGCRKCIAAFVDAFHNARPIR